MDIESKNCEEKTPSSSEIVLKYHSHYHGKIEVIPKCAITSYKDFAVWYTPGVAEPCKVIEKNKDMSFEYTNRWNTIAIVSDGTRVLGLGDIGAEAALPVMEGKALLFKYLGGVDAFPLVINVTDASKIIEFCNIVEPSFGGINLEDIEKPKCFHILDRLREELNVPVWHDDQQGTATVITAGLINALKVVGKDMKEVKIAMIGAGASNIAVERLITKVGVEPKNIVMVDSKGILHKGREDIKGKDPYKWHICLTTNAEEKVGGIKEALDGSDVCIALSKSGPEVIKKEWVKRMANNAIMFTCANPNPEIWPWEAKEAGAIVVATGRSDFPNQLNNSLAFPGIFRGALDVRAKTITDGMCIEAAKELAKIAEEKGLSEDNIIPTMGDWKVYVREAVVTGLKAMEQGVQRVKLSRDELEQRAYETIKRARDELNILMKEGIIKPLPK